ncbi:hypothetical protein [Nesterenkonia pannonica]|uniref:hypothetical protein n=1 Tax=Nesterenkonia pannonica TaxID=1548602 RepID=UPI00216400C2|nr:hypothetical protein [Nesterenkonia pannonica]
MGEPRSRPRQMPTVEGDLRALAPVSDWHLHAAENRRRSTVGPDGQDAVLEDVVIFAQRIG